MTFPAMAFPGIKGDESITKEGGGVVHVEPDRYYLMKSVGVRTNPEDHDYDKGYPFFLYDLQIVKGGPGSIGKKLQFLATWKEGAQFSQGKILKLMGLEAVAKRLEVIEIPQGDKGWKQFQDLAAKVAEKTKDLLVVALVADGNPWKDAKGNLWPTSKIVDLYSADNFDELAASVSDLPAAAPQPEEGKAEAPRRGRPAKVAAVEAKRDVEEETKDLFAGL